jgi:hypothetical protein
LPPSRLALPETDPLLLWARAAAQHAADLLPASSSLAADAKALLKDPVAVARQEWKQQLDPLVAALPANKIRQGTWTLRPAEKGGARETGKVTLTIESRSAGGDDIAATLTAPDQANVHQRMIGRVEIDAEQNRLLIHLRNPAIQPAGRAAPDYKLPAGWTNLYLVLKDEKLVGAVRCGPGTTGPVLEVTFGPPEDKPTNKPKPPEKPPTPAPKPAAPRASSAQRAGSLTAPKPAQKKAAPGAAAAERITPPAQ